MNDEIKKAYLYWEEEGDRNPHLYTSEAGRASEAISDLCKVVEMDLGDAFTAGYKAAQEETERLKSIIDKMYESRFEPDKLDIYRRQAK